MDCYGGLQEQEWEFVDDWILLLPMIIGSEDDGGDDGAEADSDSDSDDD